MNELHFDLHAARYGEVISADLEGTPYTEGQCSACPHEHRCCDLIVLSTPAEAAGILQWLSRNATDVSAMARVLQLRAEVLAQHFKKFGKNTGAAIEAWFARRIKCVFYDTATRRCGIYPVRPVACRRVYGNGGCADGGGIKGAPDTPEVLTARVARFKIHPELQQNVAELTSLVANMATSSAGMQVDSEFYSKDPAMLSDEQIIFGLAGAPIPNPVALETNHGRPRGSGHPGLEPGT